MATTDWEKLHQTFIGNMLGGMYEWLAGELMVSMKSLQDLQVGWVPIVKWKNDTTSYEGWFTIPMRDATGKVTGLALRNQSGKKVTYPGSKPGCFYVVNPAHARGDKGFSNGAHNWTRTMDAGVLCPICRKPDGCLVSSENPSDPKAAICRVKESIKPMKFGYLHIRRPEGILSVQSVLGGEGVVLALEGMSDVAAAADLGFVAVGRPGNVQGQDIVAELIRGRAVVVVGENDPKTDGKWPGRDGMMATFQTVKRVTHDAKMVMPPAFVKDFRAWKNTHGLTAEIFATYVTDQATARVDHIVLDNDAPLTITRGFLRDNYLVNKRTILRQWEENWYVYRDSQGRYELVKDAPIIQKFYQWSEGKQINKDSEKGIKLEPLIATPYMFAALKQAALADTLVESRHIPTWINNVRGPAPDDLVVFNNGILNVPAFLENEDDNLLDTTPDFFNTTALPIPFDPSAVCPTWLSFLDSSLGDEAAKIDLLQEWLGYCMTPDTSRQKMMYLRGVTGGGKGTVLHVLQALVGEMQTATTSFSDLAGPFGLSPLVGKLVCLIWDARTPKGMDAMRGLEVLLNISGNDSVQVNRKFKDQLDGARLTARITIASNVFLDVPDHSGAMLRRLNVIEFQRTFADKPDDHLKEKLLAEISGIAVWALHGLKRLLDNNKFTIPESSRLAMEEWKVDTSPTASFLRDCTDADAASVVSRDELYDCWAGWITDFRTTPVTKSVFFQRVRTNAPYAINESKVFRGIRIKKDAARRYLGKP